MNGIDYDLACPGCHRPIGDHTIRGYGDCLDAAGGNFVFPFEEIPGGAIDAEGGALAGEITIGAAVLETVLGPVPALHYRFIGPDGTPMGRRTAATVTLVMDERGLRNVAALTQQAVSGAIRHVRDRR